ncbi:MAG: hypothetical protein EBT86_13900, partial [Actinobacteria bacterium]|nr:hypothetical protein [Actinomycetota bacterium]
IATDAVTYTLVSGSLPPGLSLNSNTGVISGTITGVANDTVYTFTINAVDAQLQDSPRVFTINVTVSDPYFRLTTLLLTGNSGNTVVTDASTNNFPITVVGDSRASNFSPYLTGWSCYFDGTGDYLSVANNSAFTLGTGDFTIEFWLYPTSTTQRNIAIGGVSGSPIIYMNSSRFLEFQNFGVASIATSSNTLNLNAWNHCVASRASGTLKLFVNGVEGASVTNSTNWIGDSVEIGRDYGATYTNGYISNVRIIKGTALYTANFTPATSTLTAVANTSLLTCHANRLVDSSTNNFTITKNGDVRVESFNPFNLTNTGTAGSMYFDGTGDYLETAASNSFNLSSGDWTIDA